MRENYYILIKLEPVLKDDASIIKAIESFRTEWSFKMNHPTLGGVAKQNLAKLDDIKSVLLNPELREKEAEEAKKTISSQRTRKKQRFNYFWFNIS